LQFVNESTRGRIEEVRERFDADRREQHIALLKQKEELQAAELERAWWQRFGLGAVLLLGGVMTVGIIGRQRLVLRAKNRALAETVAAQKSAEEADRLKTRFLGIAAHDIKAPLATVNHLVEDLRLELASGGHAAAHLELIQGQVRRVICHARDFLDIAALETGRLELASTRSDLAAVARTVVEEQRWHASAKGQALTFEEPDRGTGEIMGDSNRLHQVITNLVDNAIKYSPAGATTTVSITRQADTVQLAVRDEGPGLTPQDLLQLYAPFTRGSSRPSGRESSHGYGLSIAMEIARLHGGRILAESCPGRGATFTLELPVTVTAAVPALV
jgi:signal transduction histidine kinase